jgi:hypothetical protein
MPHFRGIEGTLARGRFRGWWFGFNGIDRRLDVFSTKAELLGDLTTCGASFKAQFKVLPFWPLF